MTDEVRKVNGYYSLHVCFMREECHLRIVYFSDVQPCYVGKYVCSRPPKNQT